MAFTLDEQSRQQIVAAAQRAIDLFGSPRPILEAMGAETLAWIGETFRDGGRPAWVPLRPSTLAARRQGAGAGSSSGTPLNDNGTLRRSFDVKLLTDDRVEIGSDNPVAVWQHFGTRPYEIRPKRHGGVLAFAAVAPGAGGGTVGQRTLAGLGRARATPSGSFVVPAGRTVRGRRGGQAIAPFRQVAFAKAVKHPGLPPRPMLPTPEQIGPRLAKGATRLIEKLAGRGT